MRCQMKNLRKTKRFQRSVRNSLEIMGEIKGSVSVFSPTVVDKGELVPITLARRGEKHWYGHHYLLSAVQFQGDTELFLTVPVQ